MKLKRMLYLSAQATASKLITDVIVGSLGMQKTPFLAGRTAGFGLQPFSISGTAYVEFSLILVILRDFGVF